LRVARVWGGLAPEIDRELAVQELAEPEQPLRDGSKDFAFSGSDVSAVA